MKKFFLVLLMCFCGLLGEALAQIGVGVRGGHVLSQVSLEYIATSLTIRPRQAIVEGYEVGVVGRLMNTKHFGLQVEANYSQLGWHLYLETEGERLREFEMVQVPLVSYLQMGRGRFKFTVQAGAFASYILKNQDILAPLEEELPAEMLKMGHQKNLPWQYGILAGAGPSYHFSFGVLQLEARFSQTMSDLLEVDLIRTDDYDGFQLQNITFGLQWVYMFDRGR